MSHGVYVLISQNANKEEKRKGVWSYMCPTCICTYFLSVATTASGATQSHCWPLWNKPPLSSANMGLVVLLLLWLQHVATVKGARQAARWFIGSPSAMLSLGKWLSSKARLVLVLFTGLGRADLNYLRLPLVNTTETRRVCVCVCVQEGWTEDGRQEWRSGRCRGRDGGKKNKWAIMSCCSININHNNKWLCACLNSSPFSSLFTLHRVTLH